MASIDLEQLTKVYPGGVKAVDAIDLHIADREFVVLVGPSGCGKTTTLRMIAGLESITAGQVQIANQVVNDVAPKDRDVAMVFQNYALYPHMTVYQNLAFGLKMRGTARGEIARRVGEAARVLDIDHLLTRKPKELSGGQKQRVAVGRAIVREPAAFLFDEPLSNLDAKLRVTTRAELKRLHRQLNTTTIYVTHDQEEAMTLGDRIVVMNEGRIQQADSPLVTYNHPSNRFVAGFIGMPPMNFFEGVLTRSQDEVIFVQGSGQTAGKRPGSKANVEAVSTANELTLGGDGFRLPVPPFLRERLEMHVGSRVVLGIRPEHLHLRPQNQGADAPIEATLNVIEPLGNNMDLYLSTCLRGPVVARVEAQEGLQIDAPVTLYADLRKVHFFAPGETGMNLCQTSEPAHANA